MKTLVERYTANIQTYNELTINQWAGDFILARAMSDADIQLSQVWPTLEGEMPSALNMESTSTRGRHLWCYNAATYHHMTPDDIYSYYDFDRSWNSQVSSSLPYLSIRAFGFEKLTSYPDFQERGLPRHGDLFRHMVFPQIRDHIFDWDNLSADVKSENATFAECQEMCENQLDCLQFSLTASTCKTSQAVRLGKQQLPAQDSDERVNSGWILERVESFMETMETSCKGEGWIMP
ncbi:hypothetical protein CIB48_g6649 [Xylaria polymorpha]|nr:hypothetical protein CIB48_g6649 [Xylaria polymorpha]